MDHDNFLRRSTDDEVTDDTSVSGAAHHQGAATSASPFTIEPPPAPEMPEGASISADAKKRETSESLKRGVMAICSIVLMLLIISAFFLFRSRMTPTQETIEVKSAPFSAGNSNSAAKSDLPGPIENAKAAAAPSPDSAAAPSPVPAASQLPPYNGTRLTENSTGSIAFDGNPIYNPNAPTGQPAAASSGAAGNQGGANSSAENNGGNGFGGKSSDRTAAATGQSGKPINIGATERERGGAQSVGDEYAANYQSAAMRNNNSAAGNQGGGGRSSQNSFYYYGRSDNAAGSDKLRGNTAAPRLIAAVYKPNFGTVLPVRVIGALHTLQSGGLVRMELTRTVEGNQYRMARGTVFVGRVSGGDADRLFVSLIGYLDPKQNALIELHGDMLGIDGSIGLKGERKRLHSRWKNVFGGVLSSAKQLGSAYLLGRKGGSGGFIPVDPSAGFNNSIEGLTNQNQDSSGYVMVAAGAAGYILVNDLPASKDIPDAQIGSLGDSDLANTENLSGEQLEKVLSGDSVDDIRRLKPRMSPAWREVAEKAIAERERGGGDRP